MGNRAVITLDTPDDVSQSNELGLYIHWGGNKEAVQSFLTYCKLKKERRPEDDCYGWGALVSVMKPITGNVGIDACRNLDCNNGDNGVYLIRDWEIVGKQFEPKHELDDCDLIESLLFIDSKQPEESRLGEAEILKRLKALRETQGESHAGN